MPPQVAVMDAQWADMLRLLGSRRPALLDRDRGRRAGIGRRVGDSRVDHAFRQQLLAADDATRQSLVQRLHPPGAGPHHGHRAGEPRNRSAAEHVRSRFAARAGAQEQPRRPARLHAADGQADGRAEHRVAGGGNRAIVGRWRERIDGRPAEPASSATAEAWTPLLPLRAIGQPAAADSAARAGRRRRAATPTWCSSWATINRFTRSARAASIRICRRTSRWTK